MSFSIWRSVSLYWGEVSKSSYLGGFDSYLRGVFSFGGCTHIRGGFALEGHRRVTHTTLYCAVDCSVSAVIKVSMLSHKTPESVAHSVNGVQCLFSSPQL